MNCDETRELLSLYIDEMLDKSEIQEVEAHLSACEACRKEYNELKEMVDLLGRVGMVPVPDEFGSRLKKALKEEKQSMAEAGAINQNPKKNRWRLISSIAAVFAVGVLSFGLFHDIIGDLPDTFSAKDQTGTAPAEESHGTSGGEESKTKDSSDSAGSANMAEDDGLDSQIAALEEEAERLKKEIRAHQRDYYYGAASDRESQAVSDGDQGFLYGLEDSAGGGSQPHTGDGSSAVNNTKADPAPGASGTADMAASEPETLSGSGGVAENGQDATEKSGLAPSTGEGSRSLTGSGVERDPITIEHYNKLIEEKLKNFDYQILSSDYEQAGQWKFRILIFRDKDGNTYNEEITIIGKDGEIQTISTDEFMGL